MVDSGDYFTYIKTSALNKAANICNGLIVAQLIVMAVYVEGWEFDWSDQDLKISNRSFSKCSAFRNESHR